MFKNQQEEPAVGRLFEPELNSYLDNLRMRALRRGVLYITDQISSELAERIGLEMDEISNNGLKELRVIIVSPGGSVFTGLSIYDALQQFKNNGGKVITEARGYAASMGAVILQAGNKRYATHNTRILIHEVSEFHFFRSQTPSYAREQTKELERVNDMIVQILSERSGISPKKIKSLIKKKDYWMSAEEARELNFVDEII